MENRVAIFIDGSNLYHALKGNFKRHNLNFADFANKLCGERRLFRTYYYNVLQDPVQRPDGYRDQQEFLDVLRKTPYLEVRLGGTKTAQGVSVEKGIDVMLATDLLYLDGTTSTMWLSWLAVTAISPMPSKRQRIWGSTWKWPTLKAMCPRTFLT